MEVHRRSIRGIRRGCMWTIRSEKGEADGKQSSEGQEKLTSGAKARVNYKVLTARLKSCPPGSVLLTALTIQQGEW